MRFLLVDRIIEIESGRRALGIKNVTMSEDFLTHHFPDRPIMPGMLIVESLVQLADWLLREQTNFQQMGLAVGFERIKFRHVVRPGDQLRLDVEITAQSEEEITVRGKAFCHDKVVTTAQFTLARYLLQSALSMEESRQLFALLQDNAK